MSDHGPLRPLAALGRRFSLPLHLSSALWSISSILSGAYFTLNFFAGKEILRLFVLCVTFWFTIYVFFLLNPEANTHPL